MSNNTPKMLEPIVYKVTITLLSGLHIGAGKEALKIGGIDSAVVKHPITNEPYIPGSSLKGRMRALLEMTEYADELEVNNEGVIGPIEKPDVRIAKAFGCAKYVKIASRIIFSDFKLVVDDNIKNYVDLDEDGNIKKVKSDFFEDKAENSVPRFLSANTNPRQIERVPAGVKFGGEIVLTPVEGGDYPINQADLEEILCKGKKLVELTGLGGGVSRGNGRVKIEIEGLDCNDEK